MLLEWLYEQYLLWRVVYGDARARRRLRALYRLQGRRWMARIRVLLAATDDPAHKQLIMDAAYLELLLQIEEHLPCFAD